MQCFVWINAILYIMNKKRCIVYKCSANMILSPTSRVLIFSLVVFSTTIHCRRNPFVSYNAKCTTICTELSYDGSEQSVNQVNKPINSTQANAEAIEQIKEQINELASTLNEVLKLVQKNDSCDISTSIPTSCKEIKKRKPNSPSGIPGV